jgi:hypothetical protein
MSDFELIAIGILALLVVYLVWKFRTIDGEILDMKKVILGMSLHIIPKEMEEVLSIFSGLEKLEKLDRKVKKKGKK